MMTMIERPKEQFTLPRDGVTNPIQAWLQPVGSRRLTVCGGEERAECKSEALSLPVDLHPYPHLWSQALGSVNKIIDTVEMSFLQRMARLSLKPDTLCRILCVSVK